MATKMYSLATVRSDESLTVTFFIGFGRFSVTAAITVTVVILVVLLLLFHIVLFVLGVVRLVQQPGEEVVSAADGLLAERRQFAVLLLPLPVVADVELRELGDVPELHQLVVGTAGQEMRVVGTGDVFYGLSFVLTHAANHPIGQNVDGSI